MRSTTAARLKRTLTALLLVFVLSFGTVFADTETQAEAASGTDAQTEAAAETGSGTTEASASAAPAAAAPAAQPVSRIIKKGRYYYYKNANGKIRKKAGFVTDLGKRYYVRKGGRIRTSKSFKIKKKYYRANKQGVILTGIYKWKGKYNFSDASGIWKKTEGLVSWNGSTYYVQKGGKVLMNDAFSYKNVPYAADAAGRVTRLDIPDGDGSPVVAVAKTQVGIMTGKTYWVWYFKTKFRNTDRTPWCGTFVAWCYNAAGLYDKVTVATQYGNLGYVPTYSKYATSNGRWINPATAQGGDIIIFGNSSHVGLVEGITGDGNYIITIEGNAGPTAAFGCGKAGAVVRKAYKINSGKIKGVIRVN